MTDSTARPHVAVCPYLALDHPVRFAGWWLGPLAEFAGPWASVELESETRRFLGGFRTVDGLPVPSPALLVRIGAGVDGVPPNDGEWRALRLALGFATVDANPYWSDDNRYHGWAVATADNADLWVQPLDPEQGYVSLGRGSRVAVTVGGITTRSPDFVIPPPLELQLIRGSVRLDSETLEALYLTLAASEPHSDLVDQLRVATEWHVKSWLNSPSITWEDRLVYLKTATEGLAPNFQSHRAARFLRQRFETTLTQEGDGVGIEGLLWSPDEPSFERIDRTGRSWGNVSALEHWYLSFADARNEVLHRGFAENMRYEQPQSPYEGPYVEIADRVVREGIKVTLGLCGYPRVWRMSYARAAFDAVRRLQENNNNDA